MTDWDQGNSGLWNGAGESGNGASWVWLYHQVDSRICTQLLIGCWKLGNWFIACLVRMMSHVLSHNRAADGVEKGSWLVILFSFQRLLLPFDIWLKMSDCMSCRNYSARIAWLWQSIIFHVFRRSLKQWDDTSCWGRSWHQLHDWRWFTMLCTKLLW